MMAIIVYTNNNDNDKKHDNNYYIYMRPGQNCMGMGQTYSKIESIITIFREYTSFNQLFQGT